MDLPVLLEKLVMFLGVFFAVILLVIVAIALDLWDGVHTAKKTGQRVHSHKLRVTITKMSEYFRFILIGFLPDVLGCLLSWYVLPFVVMLFGVGLIIIEAKSMFEHATRRKSHTTELPEILQKIVECAKDADAKKLVEEIEDYVTYNKETVK